HDDAAARVHRDERAVSELRRRVARADDARDAELARYDGSMRRHTAGIGHDGGRAAHDRYPIRRRHLGDEDLAGPEARTVARVGYHTDGSARDARSRAEPAD